MGDTLNLPGKTGSAKSGGALLPEGQYAFEVMRATVQEGSDKKYPYLRVHPKCISKGAFLNTEPFPDQLSTVPDAFWKLDAFLAVCGCPEGVEAINCDNLKGQKYICTVIQSKHKEAVNNKYLNYMKWSEEAADSIAGPSKSHASEVKETEEVATDWGKK